jgi:hypothetical protein
MAFSVVWPNMVNFAGASHRPVRPSSCPSLLSVAPVRRLSPCGAVCDSI